MFDVAAPLMQALSRAQTDLSGAAAQTARAQTPFGSTRPDAAMAQTAQHALFAQALLGAVHARLSELKTAAHG
ncbi:MAG TPA: hypothetical protein VFL13_13380 [Candidatus Baltobacteraceae bacterium]|nr:hypothetical protein [Candidatus Baltobacteraceae bacterium]